MRWAQKGLSLDQANLLLALAASWVRKEQENSHQNFSFRCCGGREAQIRSVLTLLREKAATESATDELLA